VDITLTKKELGLITFKVLIEKKYMEPFNIRKFTKTNLIEAGDILSKKIKIDPELIKELNAAKLNYRKIKFLKKRLTEIAIKKVVPTTLVVLSLLALFINNGKTKIVKESPVVDKEINLKMSLDEFKEMKKTNVGHVEEKEEEITIINGTDEVFTFNKQTYYTASGNDASIQTKDGHYVGGNYYVRDNYIKYFDEEFGEVFVVAPALSIYKEYRGSVVLLEYADGTKRLAAIHDYCGAATKAELNKDKSILDLYVLDPDLAEKDHIEQDMKVSILRKGYEDVRKESYVTNCSAEGDKRMPELTNKIKQGGYENSVENRNKLMEINIFLDEYKKIYFYNADNSEFMSSNGLRVENADELVDNIIKSKSK